MAQSHFFKLRAELPPRTQFHEAVQRAHPQGWLNSEIVDQFVHCFILNRATKGRLLDQRLSFVVYGCNTALHPPGLHPPGLQDSPTLVYEVAQRAKVQAQSTRRHRPRC
ncbi:hypothetical protein PR002_g10615 [Phytophthora rubi]|uniref:Uncharacterized protein n=1 Tax=Phytophthora rubi TaxID=129364 RepID=A0A6A3MHD1_9STRA|nr:hypothetical protein PR002_g10615 [Phytophthora rubi]